VRWWLDGKIAPAVHARYPLAEFRAAMADVRERRATGRVVLLPQQ
jgi:NADPH2:quinone reductase